MTDDLIEAAWRLVHAQGRMLERWSEGDENVKRDLWRNLHEAGDALRDILNARQDAAIDRPRDGGEMTEEDWLVNHLRSRGEFDVADAVVRQAQQIAAGQLELAWRQFVDHTQQSAFGTPSPDRRSFEAGYSAAMEGK